MRLIFLIFLCFGLTSPVQGESFQGRDLILNDQRKAGAGPAALVLVLHPFLGTAQSVRRDSRFDVLARKHGLLIAYPTGTRRRWNDGRNTRMQADDVGYLAGLIQALVDQGKADPARIFVIGHSNGGGMAMRMACDRPNLIAGIAVIATKLPAAKPCRRGQPVPAIFFHGTLDAISPPEGRPAGHRLGESLSSAETLSNWARRNRCSGTPRRRTIDRRNDGTSAEILTYSGCRAALTHVLVTGHGHGWPGGGGPKRARLQGPASQEIDASQLSWQFFSGL